MSLTVIRDLPEADEVSKAMPITEAHRIPENRAAVQNILGRTDPLNRRLMIIGPCSAWPFEAVREYADRLARLQEDVHEQLLLVMRTYIQKPRTTVGWPGPLNQPDPLKAPDLYKGTWKCRKMMTDVGTMLPLADEMLFTHNSAHFNPLLSYVALGARSTEDMEHRYIASGVDCPVGVKNTTSGDIKIGVNGVQSVQSPHVFAFRNQQVQTSGNPFANLVLRGGTSGGNYDPHSLAQASHLLNERGVHNPAVIVDASHDNSRNGSGKDPLLQKLVVKNILLGIEEQREEYDLVRGFMIESFLQNGNQKISPSMRLDGLSITDPCLGWEESERLVRDTADSLAI